MDLGHGNGPIPSRIMLVGEAWGESEERAHAPFVGASGQELNRMLQEAGILRSECYVTNVVNARPKDNYLGHWIAKTKKDRTAQHVELLGKWVLPIVVEGYRRLLQEIAMVQPNIIVAFGGTALWALTQQEGIMKWRGSQLLLNRYEHRRYKIPGSINTPETDAALLYSMQETNPVKVIPCIHPAAILRQWELRAATVNDLRRVKRHMYPGAYENVPKWNFRVRPSITTVYMELAQTKLWLDMGNETWIDLDIETRGGHIACIGLSWSKLDALCIPLMCMESKEGYWSAEEEAEIVHALYEIFTHKHARIRWQNGLYDAQYIYKHWHFIPRHGQDTMISQHSCFAAQPKALAYIASMYADYYRYWKDEGKDWAANMGEDQLWGYNCQDCIYTREAGEVLSATVQKLGLAEADRVQQSLFYPVLSAMNRGVRLRPEAKTQLTLDIQEELSAREAFLADVLGHPINVGSPKQMQALFYEDLQQKVVYKRLPVAGTTVMRPTVDDEALSTIAAREPLLRPVCNAIADIRTLSKWLKDFVLMRPDTDGRMRCSFNIAGDAAGKSAPYSYRLSSSKNAFGSGGNLQTIPSEKSKSAGKAAARGSMEFALPNIRSMFGPDPGFTFFDMDLDRADLQVVIWESEDEELKAALRLGADIHLLNVFALDGVDPPPLDELVEGHPKYLEHRVPRKHKREFAKVFCHATNYGGGAKTVAAHTGRLVGEVDRAQKLWFGAHPGIKKWHERIEQQILKHRFVENRFGYKWHIFDRLDGLLPEALAWVPQSTVGCTINRIWLNMYNQVPEVQVLLQVHDSLAGQIPTHRLAALVPKMKEAARVVIPYPDPLIIPTGIKLSERSWGDCV